MIVEATNDETAALEREKLRHELLLLKRPLWRDPKVLGGIIAFLVSAAANVGQYIAAKEDAVRKDRELALKVEQWESQKRQLELELQRTKQQLQASTGQAVRSQADADELAQVKKDIGVWEAAIADSKLKIAAMRNEIPRFEKEGRKSRAEAERANVDLQEGLLKMQQAELQKSLARRGELEARLK